MAYIPYAGSLVFYLHENEQANKGNPEFNDRRCAALYSFGVFFIALYVVNMIATILMIYMSVKFSEEI